jgi:DNA-binding GntR family transcriptional regulator
MAEHDEIMNALADRNAPQLTQVLISHLKNTCASVKRVIAHGEAG